MADKTQNEIDEVLHTSMEEREEKISKPLQVILDAVPEADRPAVIKALMVISEESYSGPIPSPRSMKEYEEILEGSADRILTMAEKQQAHRIEIEKKAIASQSKITERGQIFGFIVFFCCIIISVLLIWIWDMKEIAGILLTTVMVSLVTIFVVGKRQIKSNLNTKRPQAD